jgi:hypothetical protein
MFAYPNIKVTRVNLRPLLPPGTLEKVNPQRILKKVQREVLKQIQHHIMQSTLSHRAKVSLKSGFEVQRRARSVVVVAKHPGFRPLLEGRKHRQMRWLVKAKRPIPIITDTGELIFRNATPRSMDNGSWYHPERKSTTVLEKATKAAREVLKKQLKKEFKLEIRKAMGRTGR